MASPKRSGRAKGKGQASKSAKAKDGLPRWLHRGPEPILTQLSDKQISDFEGLVAMGVTPNIAAVRLFDISLRTAQVWAQRGRAGEEPFTIYLRLIQFAYSRARMQAEMFLFANDPRTWILKGPKVVGELYEEGWHERFELTGIEGEETGEGAIIDLVESIKAKRSRQG
jgi:hypothetical protein